MRLEGRVGRLQKYKEVVLELRSKGLTWADIADWLTKRGVKVTESGLWRAFRRVDYESHD